MDLLSALRTDQIEQFKETFRWRPKGQTEVTLTQMDTTHLFNTARLLMRRLNPHQIATQNVRGPNSYACNYQTGQTLFFMIWEIERRNDLLDKYRTNYNEMLRSLYDTQFLEQEFPAKLGRPILRTEADANYIEPEFAHLFPSPPPVQNPNRLTPIANPGSVEAMITLDPTLTAAEHNRLFGGPFFHPEFMLAHLLDPDGQFSHHRWLQEIPMRYQVGVRWVDDEIMRRAQYGRALRTRGGREFTIWYLRRFMEKREQGIRSGHLTENGWATPLQFPSESFIRRMRGSARTALDREVEFTIMNMHQERQLRIRDEERAQASNRQRRNIEATRAILESRGINVVDGPTRAPVWQMIDDVETSDVPPKKKQKQKQPEVSKQPTIEQLISGKRKILIDDEGDKP